MAPKGVKHNLPSDIENAASIIRHMLKTGMLKRADVHYGVPPQRTASMNLLRMSDEVAEAVNRQTGFKVPTVRDLLNAKSANG